MSEYQLELEALAKLDATCYSDNPLTLDQWHRITSNSQYRVFAGLNDSGNQIGYGIARVQREGDSDCLKLLRLGVDPRYRRLGVARGMLDQVRNVNCELELKETNLTGLQAAVKCGFQVVGLHKQRFPDCDGVLLYRAAGS